jgi:hypothetical protein
MGEAGGNRSALQSNIIVVRKSGDLLMSKLISVSAVGALAFGAVAAHASIPSPSTGSSDAILFAEVVNAAGTAAVASYAGDTGVSINSILAGTGGGQYFAGDSNLAKLFAADTGGDTIEFAVLGGQYTGTPSTINFKTPGTAQFLTTVANNSTTALAAATTANLTHFAGLNQDIGTINSNSGGASSIEGANPAISGVWDYTNTSGTAYWDGGNVANGSLVSTVENLYYVTGAGAIASKVTFTKEATATLTAAGLTLTQGPIVPLPPAVWLLGSGLLGLAGVARRKSKA